MATALTYQEIINLSNLTLVEPERQQPQTQVLYALATAHGLNARIAIRIHTIIKRFNDEIKMFTAHRDTILTNYGVKIDEQKQELVIDEETEPAQGVTGDRVIQATEEISKLMQDKVEGIPTISAKQLTDNLREQDRVYTLLIDKGFLGVIQPLLEDDLGDEA